MSIHSTRIMARVPLGLRRAGVALATSALTTTLVAVPSLAGAQDGIRTEQDTFGAFKGSASGTPLQVLYFEDIAPVPVDPGQPHFENTINYTLTTLQTGPTSRGLASSFWPGPAVGDGLSAFGDGAPEYFVKADARYPDEPFTAEVPGMRGAALGLDVSATADGKNVNNGSDPGARDAGMGFGNAASDSITTVRDGALLTRAESSVSDLSLLGGLIRIDSVTTLLEAASDAETAATTGTTTVSGFQIAGAGFRVTQNGLEPVAGEEDPGASGIEDDEPEDPTPIGDEVGGPLGDGLGQVTENIPEQPIPFEPVLPDEFRDLLGIEARSIGHVEEVDGAKGYRFAGGVEVTIDTKALKSYLDAVPTSDIINLLDGIPVSCDDAPPEFQDGCLDGNDLKSYLFTVAAAGPKVTYRIAAAEVFVNGNKPFTFEFPPIPEFTPPPAPPAPPPPPVTSQPVITPPAPAPTTAPAPQPTVAPTPQPTFAPIAAPAGLPERWRGIPWGLLALTAALSGYAAFYMQGMTSQVASGEHVSGFGPPS